MKTIQQARRANEPPALPLTAIAEPDVFALVPIRVEEIARDEESEQALQVTREAIERRFQLD